MAELTIDYYPISTWGLTLIDTQGEVDMPMIKRPYKQNWEDAHGEDIDMTVAYFEPKDISLIFLFRANTYSQYRARLNSLKAVLCTPRLHVIKYPNAGDRPFFCYPSDVMRVERISSLSANIISSRLYLSLTEPVPVGRYFYVTQSHVTFSISCTEPILIDWGDGTTQQYVDGTYNCSHNYSGFAYMALLGDPYKINDVSSIVGITEIIGG